MALSKTSYGLGSLETCINIFVVSSHCTFSFGLSVLFHIQVADVFLEWAEQLNEGFLDDKLKRLATGTRILDPFAREPEL